MIFLYFELTTGAWYKATASFLDCRVRLKLRFAKMFSETGSSPPLGVVNPESTCWCWIVCSCGLFALVSNKVLRDWSPIGF